MMKTLLLTYNFSSSTSSAQTHNPFLLPTESPHWVLVASASGRNDGDEEQSALSVWKF